MKYLVRVSILLFLSSALVGGSPSGAACTIGPSLHGNCVAMRVLVRVMKNVIVVRRTPPTPR
ncbi:MAG: hypothetical protein ABI960_07425 [Candidatus Eisenbacteria bacterium]